MAHVLSLKFETSLSFHSNLFLYHDISVDNVFPIATEYTDYLNPTTPKPYMATCSKGLTIDTVILNGGMSSGDVTQYKNVKNMHGCLEKCCATTKCDLAYLIDNVCYIVRCFSKALCKIRPVETPGIKSEITYIQRNGIEMFDTKHDAMVNGITTNTKTSISRTTPSRPVLSKNVSESKVDQGMKKSDNLNASTPDTHSSHCKKGKTRFNVRLRGDLGAGVFTSNGLITSMEDCAKICCSSKSCDLAYMVGNSCYSVRCYSKELCQVEMATPLALNPTIAYVLRYKDSNRDHSKRA